MPGKKMGNPPGEAGAAPHVELAGVAVHLPAELASRIDDWAGEHDAATRAEAVIRLIEIGLGANSNRGVVAALRDRAASLAGQQIDRMGDATATDAERETRKSSLTDGPTAFRDIRRDRAGSND